MASRSVSFVRRRLGMFAVRTSLSSFRCSGALASSSSEIRLFSSSSSTKKGLFEDHSADNVDYSDILAAFERDGVGVVPNFATPEECRALMDRMAVLVEGWDPENPEEESVVFRTDGEQLKNQGSSDYFLDSGDKVHFFLEAAAVDPSTGKLEKGRKKEESLNKVGHGLHVADPLFREYSQSKRVARLVQALGWKDPVLPQSMYIFKQPFDGDEVTSHQDSSFLYTEPRQTCLGLWLALEDATLDNGCIWARRGSHREPLRRHFRRNPEYFSEGNADAPKMQFLEKSEQDNITWEGGFPEQGAEAAGFEAFPVRAGDLVLIHGLVDHMSMQNTSPKSRHTFQLHLVEGPSEGVTWSEHNWLQVSTPFLSLLPRH